MGTEGGCFWQGSERVAFWGSLFSFKWGLGTCWRKVALRITWVEAMLQEKAHPRRDHWACVTLPPQWLASPRHAIKPLLITPSLSRRPFVLGLSVFRDLPFRAWSQWDGRRRNLEAKIYERVLCTCYYLLPSNALPELQLPTDIIHTAFTPLAVEGSSKAPELNFWG